MIRRLKCFYAFVIIALVLLYTGAYEIPGLSNNSEALSDTQSLTFLALDDGNIILYDNDTLVLYSRSVSSEGITMLRNSDGTPRVLNSAILRAKHTDSRTGPSPVLFLIKSDK